MGRPSLKWIGIALVSAMAISLFSIVNFLFGLTPIALKPYTVGTFLGIIPGTLAYSWVGATGQQSLHGENMTGFLWALALLVILSLIPLVLRSR